MVRGGATHRIDGRCPGARGEVAELAEGARLLSECRSELSYRGFESLLLRQVAPVAQLDRASDYESKGHRFESCRARSESLVLRGFFFEPSAARSAAGRCGSTFHQRASTRINAQFCAVRAVRAARVGLRAARVGLRAARMARAATPTLVFLYTVEGQQSRRLSRRRAGQRRKMGVEMEGVREPVVVGGYRSGRRLDVAGSAETYQATGPDGEVVVLKVLRDVSPDLAADMSTRLEVAAGHPGLIVPSAWGRDGDDFYVVRDYIAGIDLESMIQAGGPLEPSLAVRYVAQAASAVASIESQGLSHGNLKTSNLLVSAESDEVKVVGWGMAIANLLPEGESRAATTAYYLSPEQIQSDLVIPRVRRLRTGSDPIRAGDRSGPVRRLLGRRGGPEAPDHAADRSEPTPGRRAQVGRQGSPPGAAEGPRRPVPVGRGDEAGAGRRGLAERPQDKAVSWRGFSLFRETRRVTPRPEPSGRRRAWPAPAAATHRAKRPGLETRSAASRAASSSGLTACPGSSGASKAATMKRS